MRIHSSNLAHHYLLAFKVYFVFFHITLVVDGFVKWMWSRVVNNNNKKKRWQLQLTWHPTSILSHHGSMTSLAWPWGHPLYFNPFGWRWVLWWKHELRVLFPLHLRKAHQATKHLGSFHLVLFFSPPLLSALFYWWLASFHHHHHPF